MGVLEIVIGIVFLICVSQGISFFLFGNKNIFKYRFEEFVYRQIFGSLSLVSIISLTFTKGNSIFIIAIPIILFTALHHKAQTKTGITSAKILVSEITALIFFLIFAITLSFFLIAGTDYHGYKLMAMDQAFYSSFVNTINFTGIESTKCMLDPLAVNVKSIPYHFYEIWLSIIIKKIFGYSGQMSMFGVVLAYTLFLIFSNVYLIFKSFSKNVNVFLLIAIALLFVNNRAFLYFFNPTININSVLFEGNQKYLYPLMFFLFGIKACFSDKKELALMLMVLLPVINIVFMPAVLAGTGVYLFYIIVRQRSTLQDVFSVNRPLIISLCTYLFLFVFYLLFMIEKGESRSDLQTSLGGIFFTILEDGGKFLIYNSLFICVVLFFLYRKQISEKGKEMLIYFSFILVFGLLARAIMDNNQNSYQIFQSVNIFVTFGLFIIISECFIITLFNFRKLILSVLGLISLLILLQDNFNKSGFKLYCTYSAYSNRYLNEIAQEKFSNTIGIKCVNAKKRIMKRRNPVYCGVSEYMPVVNNITYSIVINPIELLPEEEKSFISQIQKMEFINSSVFLKGSMVRNEIDSAKYNLEIVNYVKRLKPEFCIVEEGTSPPTFLNQYIYKVIEDEKSKEKFYLLRII